MSERNLNSTSMKSVLRGGVVCFASLLILSLLASVIVGRTDIREKSMVYVSSALTFVSSAIAGCTLRRRKEKMVFCLILSLFLIIIALSLGFLLDSTRLELGGILSVASFTICGVLSGYVLEAPRIKRSRVKI